MRIAQRILACCFFARDDSLNVLRLFELYFLSCMVAGVQLDPVYFWPGNCIVLLLALRVG